MSDTYISVCTSGTQFFWVVAQSQTLLASGHEAERWLAECKAYEHARMHADLSTVDKLQDYFAEYFRAKLFDKEHNSTPTGETVHQSFLGFNDGEPVVWHVVRKTPKRIFLRCFDGPLAFQNDTASIDRLKFESTGWGHAGRRSFYDPARHG